ncbi:MAG: UDP-glucose/GDP-mannose dehydrogenase family protein [Anaerolineales bacterium]|nr:UDP-glucose/GDP-mannose dehydrogenase family protein [Anaerolineales bacterium]MCK5635195.1 UDP-glucose/GDP-mannose dehydrogenase family protein [Anaerolineales bacterium]
MKQIAVVGVGYVGLVSAAGFADLGNRVIALDINEERINDLKKGIMPIYEPGLEEMVARNVASERLSFTSSYPEAIQGADFVFIAVGTPSGVDGEADLKYVKSAAESVAQAMDAPLVVINKSTVPVGTGDWVAEIIRTSQPKPIPFSVVSCPEFLREGSAILDFMNPARTVLGSQDFEAADKVAQLHLPLRAPIMITNLRTAEMVKYASNAFLATRISFINEIANICEELGADVKEVSTGMGYDPRIGPYFLDAGLGYGGSCFPKDVKALAHMADEKGRHPQLLQAVMDINDDRRRLLVEKIRDGVGEFEGKVIGVLGLTFKPNTDDLRDAPALDIAERLLKDGVKVRAYDPVGMPGAAKLMPAIEMAADPYALAEGSDALVICTEWNEFKQLDLQRIKDLMRSPVVIDGRNIYEPHEMDRLGFTYLAVGRGYNDGLPMNG